MKYEKKPIFLKQMLRWAWGLDFGIRWETSDFLSIDFYD